MIGRHVLFAAALDGDPAGGVNECRTQRIHRRQNLCIAGLGRRQRARPEHGTLTSQERFQLDRDRCAFPATRDRPRGRCEHQTGQHAFDEIDSVGRVADGAHGFEVCDQRHQIEQPAFAGDAKQLPVRGLALVCDHPGIDLEYRQPTLPGDRAEQRASSAANPSLEQHHRGAIERALDGFAHPLRDL
ncbi:MAG: hypothetical protein H0T46_06960 [Deltaproteobacteria bacterium]|nr:hypothetical protein [Deltaproteobacteria bacterium]